MPMIIYGWLIENDSKNKLVSQFNKPCLFGLAVPALYVVPNPTQLDQASASSALSIASASLFRKERGERNTPFALSHILCNDPSTMPILLR